MMTLQEAIETLIRVRESFEFIRVNESFEFHKDDFTDVWDEESSSAIATVLNAVMDGSLTFTVKGELK